MDLFEGLDHVPPGKLRTELNLTLSILGASADIRNLNDPDARRCPRATCGFSVPHAARLPAFPTLTGFISDSYLTRKV
jgi:hypothetical protein